MKIIITLCLCIMSMFAKEISPIKVLVSVLPQKEMIERIGGEYVKVEVLVPAGKSPEIYEPSFAQMRHIEDSHIFFGVGMPFESAWLKRFKNTNPSLIYYNLADPFVDSKNTESQHTAHKHTHNPHIWLSLKASILHTQIIAQTLSKINKEQTTFFMQNAKLLESKLHSIQKRTAHIFSLDTAQKSFIIYHPALKYWSEEFHIKELSLENEGKELKGRDLSALIQEAKKQKIASIFIQPEFAKSRAKSFANELDLNIIELDVLRQDWLLSLQEIACQVAFSLSSTQSKSCVQAYFKDEL